MNPNDSTRLPGDGASLPTVLPGAAVAGGGESVGEMIGPYRLVTIIGEGGFGVVWLAERREPMVQRVALKIMKPGMDFGSVVARFEQERQALAVMDHPNVAKVFDGGVTASGRPYFVMEHVEGEPITDFCDRHNFSIRKRLELFIPVCEAVQHAHHKGIIHRDLKPSNILVEMIEGTPVVKVIDFGVAKAIANEIRTHSAYTQAGMIIGTPAYMSPEQVLGLLDIDTRADVYSLGVVLYEVLTGELPFDPRELREAGYAELQRIIQERTPPKPSTRLAQIARDRTTTVAQARSTSSEQLASELRRELDWIPLMALRKERERRYASPQALAEDLRRYLDSRPLAAAPDSRMYLARKFVRRNLTQVLAAIAVIVALVGGLGAALWQANEAARQRDAALASEAAASAARDAEKSRAEELRQVSAFQSSMLSQVDPNTAGVALMRDIRERYAAALEKAGTPEVERTLRLKGFDAELARVNATDTAAEMVDQTMLRPAVKAIDEKFKDHPVIDAQLRQTLANSYRHLGLYDSATPLQASALAKRRTVLGNNHPDTIDSIQRQGELHLDRGEYSEAESRLQEAFDWRHRELSLSHSETGDSLRLLYQSLILQNRMDEASNLWDQFDQALVERLDSGEDRLSTAPFSSVEEMASSVASITRWAESQTDSLINAETDETKAQSLVAARDLLTGMRLQFEGRLAEAEPYLLRSLEYSRRTRGDAHPETLHAAELLGGLLVKQEKFTEAEPLYRDTLERSVHSLGASHPDTLRLAIQLGRILNALSKSQAAIDLLNETEIAARPVGTPSAHLESLLIVRGEAYLGLGCEHESLQLAERDLQEAFHLLDRAHPKPIGVIQKCCRGLIALYTAWSEAEPGEGYDAKAAEWQGVLERLKQPAEPPAVGG